MGGGRGKSVAPGESGGDVSPRTGFQGIPAQRELDANESKAAWGTWKGLSRFVSDQNGRLESNEGGVATYRFPNGARASGFYDQTVSRYLLAEQSGPFTVRVQRPKPRTD